MVKIGMMIGDRYEIIEKIGTGGMSDVYKAKCHKLNRFVAVKVLKQEFSENANFVSKFRIEAQAAAGLAHPNIVNVYDVGEENGIYYIVMELVEGITLKKYIEKKARLTYKEAVSIAIQVSMGILAAHNNYIIHRDIKPQNIIISRDGKVKVTDFGIAKAATSDTITSNVMGSVHYTSPEQARGGYSDEKSDIYSLGITMFEMLAGRVPFNGETTVAIAIRHIQEELPSLNKFVPDVPASVVAIVEKCCRKSPDRRYQSMTEVITDLKHSLMNPDENFVAADDEETEANTRTITQSDMEQIKRRTSYPDYQDGTSHGNRDEQPRAYQETYEPPYEEEDEDDEEYDDGMGVEKITTLLAIGSGAVICLILIFFAIRLFAGLGNPDPGSTPTPGIIVETKDPEANLVVMPPIAGHNVETVRNMLNDIGLKTEVSYVESDTKPIGEVIGANVEEGKKVEKGTLVKLTASAGPESMTVPPVTGLSFEEASAKLEGMGFLVAKLEVASNSVAIGKVASQSPAGGERLPKKSTVTLSVSRGAESSEVQVPSLLGETEMDATIKAIEAGLKVVSVSYVYSAEYEVGRVCYQSYSYGTWVPKESEIEIRISKGPEFSYRCNIDVQAPTQAEAPGYVTGTPVAIKLLADDGKILVDATVTSFPYTINAYGLNTAGGTLTLVYTVTKEPTSTTGPDGQIVTVPGKQEERFFSRRVEFSAE